MLIREMIVADMQPSSMVEDVVFTALMPEHISRTRLLDAIWKNRDGLDGEIALQASALKHHKGH